MTVQYEYYIQSVVGNIVVNVTGSISLSVDNSLIHGNNISSVSPPQCCSWYYVVDVTGSVILSVDDSLVPMITSVQYQCQNAAADNTVCI